MSLFGNDSLDMGLSQLTQKPVDLEEDWCKFTDQDSGFDELSTEQCNEQLVFTMEQSQMEQPKGNIPKSASKTRKRKSLDKKNKTAKSSVPKRPASLPLPDTSSVIVEKQDIFNEKPTISQVLEYNEELTRFSLNYGRIVVITRDSSKRFVQFMVFKQCAPDYFWRRYQSLSLGQIEFERLILRFSHFVDAYHNISSGDGVPFNSTMDPYDPKKVMTMEEDVEKSRYYWSEDLWGYKATRNSEWDSQFQTGISVSHARCSE